MFYQTVMAGGSAQTQRGKLDLIQGTGMTITCSDNTGLNSSDCTFTATGASFYQTLQLAGAGQTQRGKLNLIAGAGITISYSDNAGSNSSDVTIAAVATVPGGSDGDYQKKSSTSFVAGSLKEDAAIRTRRRPCTRPLPQSPSPAAHRSSTSPSETGSKSPSPGTRPPPGRISARERSSPSPRRRTVLAPHGLTWPVGTLNACSPWQVANSVTTVDFEIAIDGSTVTAKGCSVYDPANPGVVFYGLMRGSIPTPAAGNLACGFDSGSTTWKCVAPDGSVSTAVKALTIVSHQFVSSLSSNGVLGTTQPALTDMVETGAPTRSIKATFDGGGTALSAGMTRCALINFGGTIQQASLVADLSGSVTVDVKTVTYSSFTGPASASSITAAAIPALSSAVKYQDATLTGWTTALTSNSVVCFVLSAPATSYTGCRPI